MERRSPLTPSHVKKLIEEQGLSICIQKSAKRIFADEEYEKAAHLRDWIKDLESG